MRASRTASAQLLAVAANTSRWKQFVFLGIHEIIPVFASLVLKLTTD